MFTCLSHDIVAHETAHALLDGVHPRFNEPVNGDVLAFHEAFSDIVALFQHFSYPGVLLDQVSRTRGNLAAESLLPQLAQQFGRATGRGTALRDALGGVNPATGEWEPRRPDPEALARTPEPHARGALLVAAVFGAFLKAYRNRTEDLYRIASDGTGVLREGAIHPDLAARLAGEAARCAKAIQQMCIRAIDYCPPVGITFGDYLRAIVTGDAAQYPEDSDRFRVAMLESFRQWGIHPAGMRTVSPETLRWPTLEEELRELGRRAPLDRFNRVLATLFQAKGDAKSTKGVPDKDRVFAPWTLDSDRLQTWRGESVNATIFWQWLVIGQGRRFAEACGLRIKAKGAPATIVRSKACTGTLAVEVHSVRTALRRSARGATVPDLAVGITQRRFGFFDPDLQRKYDAGPPEKVPRKPDFIHRAGCTLIIDVETRRVDRVRVIRTAAIDDDDALREAREFRLRQLGVSENAFDLPRTGFLAREPFAFVHRHEEH